MIITRVILALGDQNCDHAMQPLLDMYVYYSVERDGMELPIGILEQQGNRFESYHPKRVGASDSLLQATPAHAALR